MKKSKLILCVVFLIAIQFSFSQGSPDYNGGFKIKFNDDGSKYLRVISWGQFQAIYDNEAAEDESKTSFNVRRARVLLLSQINKKFLLVTHFGLNSLNASNLDPVGKSDDSELFMHGIWGQWNLSDNHTVGGGLHYWNGISRLNNQSTLNLLTLDNNRQSWSTLGLSDQFGRHVGVFLKGKFDKFKYQLAINDTAENGLDTRTPEAGGDAVYGGRRLLGSKDAGYAFAGYFEYNFLDQESNTLPYKVGSYLGGKKVFNIGAGFFSHPKGSVTMNSLGDYEGENVSIFAVDAFYDSPLGEDESAITAYATYQSNDYGKDYFYSAYGTGSMFYSHLGYLFAGDKAKTRIQPYLSYASNSYDAVDNNRNVFGVGTNLFMNGHNSKLTLEYKNQEFGESTSTITLQAMIYL